MGAACLLLVVWLFAKRDAFDRPFSIKDMERHAEELKEEWGHRKQRGWKRKPKEPR